MSFCMGINFTFFPGNGARMLALGSLDVVGEINMNSSKLHKYILTTTDYFSKWTEVIPLKVINDKEVIQFLQQNIITRFGAPNCLVFDNAKYFPSLKIVEFALKYKINIKYSTNYYP